MKEGARIPGRKLEKAGKANRDSNAGRYTMGVPRNAAGLQSYCKQGRFDSGKATHCSDYPDGVLARVSRAVPDPGLGTLYRTDSSPGAGFRGP